MRKLICLLLVVLLLAAVPLTVFAAPDPVTDEAGLLTESQDHELTSLLGKPGIGTLCVVTLESLKYGSTWDWDCDTIEDYAETWAEKAGVGVVFMITMEERQWCITAAPEYEPVINGSVIEKIAAECVPHLQKGEYYEAFVIFAERCTEHLEGYEPSAPATGGAPGKAGGITFGRVLICLVIGLAVGGIAAGIMAGMNNSVKPRSSAADYVRSGSLQLRSSRDIYLYHHITRTPKAQNNSSSGGSSGGSRSTRSGSF